MENLIDPNTSSISVLTEPQNVGITFFLNNDRGGSVKFASSNFTNFFNLSSGFFLENSVNFISMLCKEENFEIFTDSPHDLGGDLNRFNKQYLAFENSKPLYERFYCTVKELRNTDNKVEFYELNLFLPDVIKDVDLLYDSTINVGSQIPMLANNSFEALLITENGFCIGLNSAAAKIFGFKEDEVLGKHASTIIHPSSQALVFENMKNGVTEPYEMLAVKKGGDLFHAEAQGKTVVIGNRNIRITSLRDISDRKKAEGLLRTEKESLKESNIELKSKTIFLEAINELTRKLGSIHFVDELFWVLIELVQNKFGFTDCVVYQLDSETNNLVEKKRNRDGSSSNMKPLVFRNFEGIVGACARTKKTILVKDIKLDSRYISDGFNGRSEIAVPILIDNQVFGVIDSEHAEVNYFTLSHQEVLTTIATLAGARIKNIKAELLVKKSESLYRKLLEITSSVAWEYDLKNSKISYMSSQIERITGYHKSEWVDYDFWVSIVHPDDRERARNYCEKHIALGLNYNHEYRIIRENGTIGWFHEVVTVLIENGKPVTKRGCFLDITKEKEAGIEKKKFTQELQEKVDELEVAKRKFENIFDESRVALMEQDFSEFLIGIQKDKRFEDSWDESVKLNSNWFLEHMDKVKVNMVNQASVKLFEAKNKRELMARITEIVTTKAIHGFIQVTKGVLNGDMESTVQTQLKTLNGDELTGVVKFFFKIDEKNNKLMANVSILNVTERVKNERQLSQHNKSLQALSRKLSVNNKMLLHSEANLEVLFQENPVSIVEFGISELIKVLEGKDMSHVNFLKLMDDDSEFLKFCMTKLTILKANKRLFKLLGQTSILDVQESMVTNQNTHFLTFFRRLISELHFGNTKFSGHTELVHVSGEKIFTLIKVVIMQSTGNALVSIVNISEIKRVEQELRIAKMKAEEGERLKTEFLNNLSHEIRTPLNGVIGFSNILAEENPGREQAQQYAKIIRNSGNQLIHIIDEIIEISKLQTNQAHTREVSVCLNHLTNELFAIFRLESKEKNITFDMSQSLSDKESTILVDDIKLQKILSNLLQNAFKFTRSGEISFGYILVNEELEFFVSDTGIGIEESKMDRIFEKFAQADKSISADYGGLGLGLFIVKEHVDLLKGSTRVESTVNEGTTFRVRIPYNSIYKEQSFHQSPLINSEKEISKASAILVVEDDQVNALYLKSLLKKIGVGCRVIYAKNGEEAVSACTPENGIVLILMDIGMPVMDGYQATKIIKSKMPHIPIIAQTAYSTSEDQEKIANVGMDDFIAKPIDRNKLQNVLLKYISLQEVELN